MAEDNQIVSLILHKTHVIEECQSWVTGWLYGSRILTDRS